MAQDRREPSAVHVVGNMDWDGLHRPQIYYAMVAIFSGLFLSVIDGTICNVALPTIARQLQISSSDSIYWIFFIVAFVLFCVVPSVASGVVFSSVGRCVSGSFVFSSVSGSVSFCVLLSPESSVFSGLSVLSCFCVRCVVALLFVDACVFFVVCSAV